MKSIVWELYNVQSPKSPLVLADFLKGGFQRSVGCGMCRETGIEPVVFILYLKPRSTVHHYCTVIACQCVKLNVIYCLQLIYTDSFFFFLQFFFFFFLVSTRKVVYIY